MMGGAPPPVAARPAAIPPAAPTIPAPSASIFPLFGCLEARFTGAAWKGGTGAAGAALAKSLVILGCLGVASLLAGGGLFLPVEALGTLARGGSGERGAAGGIEASGAN
jgi:hypothetical protein